MLSMEAEVEELRAQNKYFREHDLVLERKYLDEKKTLVENLRDRKAVIRVELQQAQEGLAEMRERFKATQQKFIDKKREYDDQRKVWRLEHILDIDGATTRKSMIDMDREV